MSTKQPKFINRLNAVHHFADVDGSRVKEELPIAAVFSSFTAAHMDILGFYHSHRTKAWSRDWLLITVKV